MSLDAAEALQLLRLHRHLLTEADLAGGAADERDTVGVHGFVDGRGAGLGASHGHAFRGLLPDRTSVALTDPFDDSSLHREFDEVERDEPDNVLRHI